MIRFTLAMISLLLLLALSGCATARGTSPQGLEFPIERAIIKLNADIAAGGYRVVTTEELKRWFDEGREMVVISTLPLEDEKVMGIIPGSVHATMPLIEREMTPEDREHILRAAGNDKGKAVVVYSGFVSCRRSHVGAKFLIDNGFKNVYRYPAGAVAWGEAGHGMLSSPKLQ